MALNTFDLQLFAEESMGGEPVQAATGQYEAAPVGGNEQDATVDQESFDSLIKGRYKNDFNAAVEGIVKKRLAKSKRDTDLVDRLGPAFQLLAKNYGMDVDDIRKADIDLFLQKAMDDNRFYEDIAAQMGLSEDQAKRVYQTEQRNKQLERQEQERAEEIEQRQVFANLVKQGDALKQKYPSFDLDTEMQNEEFLKMVIPTSKGGLGIPMENAFYALHKDEIERGAMQYAVQRTAEQISNSIQAGAARPREAGLQSGTPNGSLTVNPRNLSKAQRDEIRKRVQRGEKITF